MKKDIVAFTVEAPPSFAMNLLTARGFYLKKINREGRKLSFCADLVEKERVKEILRKHNIPFTTDYIKGRVTAIKSFIKRIGLIAGMLIGFLGITLYFNTLTAVEISGLERVDERSVQTVLVENGIKTPAVFLKSDFEKTKNGILDIDGVSGVSIEKKGTVLYVKIAEELTASDIKDTQTPIPIVAEKDGLITKLVAIKGTPLVKQGDTVRRGDVLIAPYVTDGAGNKMPCRAIGEVYARVWYKRTSVYGEKMIASVRTGNSKTVTAIEILGLTYHPACPFTVYEKEEKKVLVGAMLPYAVRTITYYEIEKREIVYNFEENAPLLIEEGKEKLQAEIAPDARSIRNWYIIKKLDKGTELSIYYETEEKIAFH